MASTNNLWKKVGASKKEINLKRKISDEEEDHTAKLKSMNITITINL